MSRADPSECPLYKAEETVKETYSDAELTALLKKPDIRKTTFAEYRDWVIINFSFELREPRRDGQGDTNSGRGFGRRRCVLPPHEEQKSAGHSPLQPHDCHSAGVWAIPWRGSLRIISLHRNGYTTDGERLAAIYRKYNTQRRLLPICNIIVNQHPSDNREKGLAFFSDDGGYNYYIVLAGHPAVFL